MDNRMRGGDSYVGTNRIINIAKLGHSLSSFTNVQWAPLTTFEISILIAIRNYKRCLIELDTVTFINIESPIVYASYNRISKKIVNQK